MVVFSMNGGWDYTFWENHDQAVDLGRVPFFWTKPLIFSPRFKHQTYWGINDKWSLVDAKIFCVDSKKYTTI